MKKTWAEPCYLQTCNSISMAAINIKVVCNEYFNAKKATILLINLMTEQQLKF